jgi:hypothetical protein
LEWSQEEFESVVSKRSHSGYKCLSSKRSLAEDRDLDEIWSEQSDGMKHLEASDILDQESGRQRIYLGELGQNVLDKKEKGPSARVGSTLGIGVENGVRLAGRGEKPEIRTESGEVGCREPGDVGLRRRRISARRAGG